MASRLGLGKLLPGDGDRALQRTPEFQMVGAGIQQRCALLHQPASLVRANDPSMHKGLRGNLISVYSFFHKLSRGE
ncbi:MAG: hypothetical protein Fur0046_02020 [Cyanobacteria bacterium J069]